MLLGGSKLMQLIRLCYRDPQLWLVRDAEVFDICPPFLTLSYLFACLFPI